MSLCLELRSAHFLDPNLSPRVQGEVLTTGNRHNDLAMMCMSTMLPEKNALPDSKGQVPGTDGYGHFHVG